LTAVTTTSNNRNVNNNERNKKEKTEDLSSKDWIQLYNKTFDTNKNQLTFQEKHIVMFSKKKEMENENESNFDDIELGRSNNDGGDSDDESSIYLTRDVARIANSQRSFLRLSPFADSDRDDDGTKINGTCIICLIEFEPGDKIVWASNDINIDNKETNE